MFKKLMSAVAAAALCVSLAACGATATSEAAAEATATPAPAVTEAPAEETASAETADGALRVAGLKGPTTMGLVNLLSMEEDGTASMDYDLQLYGAADEIVPLLVKGDLDAAAVPANLAATHYNKTNGAVEEACITTLGVLYIVENGETVNSVGDLKGQTIVTTGKGATPEYALTYLLSQHGLTLGEDVQVEWKSEPTEIVALMAEQDNAVAMLPQPFVTVAQSQVEGLRVALDLSAEWGALDNGSRLVTSVLVARKAFADEHPAALAAFLEDYAASTDYANEHPAEAAVLVEKYGIVKAAVAEKALPQCNLVCITGVDMKVAVGGYLQTLYDLKTEAVGGAMPGDGFYWMGACAHLRTKK